MTSRVKRGFDLFGLLVAIAAVGLGLWERLDGRPATGDYLLGLGAALGLVAVVSVVRRART